MQVTQLSKVLQKLWVSEIMNKLSEINNGTQRFIILQNTVFWYVAPCSFVNVNIYQELINSIFSSTLKTETVSSSSMQFKFQMNCPFLQRARARAHTHTHTHTHKNNVSPTWCVTKVMTLNAWLDNWQCCNHTSDTSRDINSYLMISASFNSIALTSVFWQRVV